MSQPVLKSGLIACLCACVVRERDAQRALVFVLVCVCALNFVCVCLRDDFCARAREIFRDREFSHFFLAPEFQATNQEPLARSLTAAAYHPPSEFPATLVFIAAKFRYTFNFARGS